MRKPPCRVSRATGAAPPATRWVPREVLTDLGHHVVYVTATSVAYRWLAQQVRP